MEEEKCYNGSLTGNIKCVIISLILAGGYWFAPQKNKWILLGILYFTYLLIAWYDYYLCDRVLTPTYLRHFYEWAKPSGSTQTKLYNNLCPDAEKQIIIVDVIIGIFAILLIPIFLKWKP